MLCGTFLGAPEGAVRMSWVQFSCRGAGIRQDGWLGWACPGQVGTVQIPAPGVLLSTRTHTAGEVRQELPARLALRAEPGTASPQAEEPPGDLQFPPELTFLEAKCWKSA